MYDHTRPEGHILTFGTEMERECFLPLRDAGGSYSQVLVLFLGERA